MEKKFNIAKIPEGIWLKRDGDIVVLGSILKNYQYSYQIIFTFLWAIGIIVLFACAFFLAQSKEDTFQYVGLAIFFCIPLPFLWPITLNILFGKVEIRLDATEGRIFEGIGSSGSTTKFKYKDIDKIEQVYAGNNNGADVYAIQFSGEKKPIRFGKYMSQERRDFLINAIRAFMVDDDTVRNTLEVNLFEHLVG